MQNGGFHYIHYCPPIEAQGWLTFGTDTTGDIREKLVFYYPRLDEARAWSA